MRFLLWPISFLFSLALAGYVSARGWIAERREKAGDIKHFFISCGGFLE